MMGMHLRDPMRWVIGDIVPKIPNVVVLIRPSCGYYEEKLQIYWVKRYLIHTKYQIFG